MATERKFTRFAPVDRPMTTREIPEGGFCLSTFLVIGRTGRPSQVLMGHLNPSGPWDHIGALDQERAEVNSKGWMLPASHIMVGESPVAAAERILKEQLGLPMLPLNGPHVFSEVYGAKNHWDLEFVFLGERDQIGQHPAWSELAFVDVSETPRDQVAATTRTSWPTSGGGTRQGAKHRNAGRRLGIPRPPRNRRNADSSTT